MRFSLIGCVSALALAAPLAALAAEPVPAAAPTYDSAPAAQMASPAQGADPIVCMYYYHEGSVVGRPDCRTRHQWERRRLAEQRFFREFQLRALAQQP